MNSTPPDSSNADKRLAVINAEIQSIETVQQRNFLQIQWMFTTYLAVVATYLSIGGFLGKDLASHLGNISGFATSRWIPVIVGLPPTALVFFLSWLVLSLFAHKIRDHLLLSKQMQKMKLLRAELFNADKATSRLYTDCNADEPYVPEFLTYLPVIYFIGNLLLLQASVIYLLVLSRVNFSAAFAWGLAAVMLVSFFYHKAITAYFKHYDAGRFCLTIEEVKVFEEACEQQRKPPKDSNLPWLSIAVKVFLVALVSSFAVILTGMDLTSTPGIKPWSLKQGMISASSYYHESLSFAIYSGLKWPLVMFCLGVAMVTFLLKWRSTVSGNASARDAAKSALSAFRSSQISVSEIPGATTAPAALPTSVPQIRTQSIPPGGSLN